MSVHGPIEARASSRFVTEKRIRNYPRIFLVANVLIASLNLVAASGWRGVFGSIIAPDFLVFYAAGILSRFQEARLYDFGAQLELQRQIISPTLLPGTGPFSNPPYVGTFLSGFTFVPYLPALLIWTLLSVGMAVVASLMCGSLANRMQKVSLPNSHWIVLVLGSFPFISGLLAGQFHTLILLGTTLVTIACVRRRWYLAGFGACILLLKPQLAVGVIIVWLATGKLKPIISFGIGAVALVIASLVRPGWDRYREYLGVVNSLLGLPRTPNWPAELMMTPYGLMATLLRNVSLQNIRVVSLVFALLFTIVLAIVAFRYRERPNTLLALGLLWPFLASPYVLLHDGLILLPVFLLWATEAAETKIIIRTAAATYLGVVVLPLLGLMKHVALPALVPLAIAALMVRELVANPLPMEPQAQVFGESMVGKTV